MPKQWPDAERESTSAQAPDLSRWWQRLGDPVLTALIDEAVKGNLDVATAKARVREARGGYRQESGALLPSVNASGSLTRNRSGAIVLGNEAGGSPLTYDQFQAGFDASWELDLFGKNHRRAEAAGYAVDAAEAGLRASLLTLIGDVAANYMQARGYQARIALAERTAAAQRQTAALTRVKLEAGTSSGLDIANATGQASSTEARIGTLRASYAEAVHRLGVLLGREPSALIDRLATDTRIPIPDRPVPMGVPADILSARPDVRQAERKLAQATATIGAAEAARYPSVSLSGNIATSGANLGDLAKGTSIGWVFGPTISVPLFNAGQLAAKVEIAEAQRDQAYLALRSTVLTALEDVENAAVALAQERRRHEKLVESVEAFREAARLARSLYQSGSTSFLEVLEAERSLYSAEDALLQSRVAIATNYIALNKALGGGWDGVIETAKPEIVDTGTGPHLRSLRN